MFVGRLWPQPDPPGTPDQQLLHLCCWRRSTRVSCLGTPLFWISQLLNINSEVYLPLSHCHVPGISVCSDQFRLSVLLAAKNHGISEILARESLMSWPLSSLARLMRAMSGRRPLVRFSFDSKLVYPQWEGSQVALVSLTTLRENIMNFHSSSLLLNMQT